jgi:IS5 family transposase
MQAKPTVKDQENMFKSRLDQILDPKHPLFVLAGKIDWKYFENELGEYYAEGRGRPALPIRLMVGIHYLKGAYDVSDEGVVEAFLENPYWQYFLGYEFFQHRFPLDPTSLVKWRQRIGPSGLELLLEELLSMAQRMRLIKPGDLRRVTVDTTVQEKAVAFPTDSRLYEKGRELLVRQAMAKGIKLRQSYSRLGRRAAIMQGRYSRAGQYKRAKREERKLKTYFGRVLRDVERKLSSEQRPEWELLLGLCHRVLQQQRSHKHKLYSFHAPEVECIGKGKAHKKYEFGNKVSIVTTTRDNWVLGIQGLHGNPYDGHTLAGAITQAERLSGGMIDTIFVDRGYRGHDYTGGAEVHIAGKKNISRSLKRWLKRRNAIEPVIGHLKTDNGLDRNYLMREVGDQINAILAGCGFNFRKVLRAILFVPFFMCIKIAQIYPEKKISSLPTSRFPLMAQ